MNDHREDSAPSPARRRFLAGGARLLFLGTMGAYFAQQGMKARRLEDDPNCIRLHTCQHCIELSSGCQLPKAESFRSARIERGRTPRPSADPEPPRSS